MCTVAAVTGWRVRSLTTTGVEPPPLDGQLHHGAGIRQRVAQRALLDREAQRILAAGRRRHPESRRCDAGAAPRANRRPHAVRHAGLLSGSVPSAAFDGSADLERAAGRDAYTCRSARIPFARR